jgi:hypothetical protein
MRHPASCFLTLLASAQPIRFGAVRLMVAAFLLDRRT